MLCRYHLAHGLDESCALDVADQGAQEFERIAELMRCSEVNVRVTIGAAIAKLRRALRLNEEGSTHE